MTDLPTTVGDLNDLAVRGSVAVVGALATGAFQAARWGIVRLFGRLGSGHEATARTQVDADEELVRSSEVAERDDVRQELAPVWRRRLVRLLRDCPETEQELRDLLITLHEALPEERQVWVQTIIARDHASAYGAQGGNVYHYQGTAQRGAPSAAGVPTDDDRPESGAE